MNRVLAISLGIVAVIGSLVALVVSVALVQEKQEKLFTMQENSRLKNQMTTLAVEAQKLIEAKSIPSKEIAGFGRNLTTDKV